jgi:hypothetical protein
MGCGDKWVAETGGSSVPGKPGLHIQTLPTPPPYKKGKKKAKCFIKSKLPSLQTDANFFNAIKL